jgi:circadian clock protein KaiC
MQFLVNGVVRHGEPGVFIAFEESAQDLITNMASLGIDLERLCADNQLVLDWVRIEPGEIEEAGEYDLGGLFVRIQCALQRIHARRIALDSLEALFSTLNNHNLLRSELRRLFSWLKEQQLTAIITGERGDGRLTRNGLEEYVADCVLTLDHELDKQLSTRHLRVVKYRGSSHGPDQYPFLIDKNGFSVFPITSVGLDCPAPSDQISTGVPRLDAMLRGGGVYRGSTILVSGAAGTGKTSLAAHFVRAACERGERALYFAFEESREQIIRNMRSIGIDLAPWMERDLLRFHASRPSLCGLEAHLAGILAKVNEFMPGVIVFDPITDFVAMGSRNEVKAMLTRLVDFLKMNKITAFLSSLTLAEHVQEQSETGISSLIDCWLLLRSLEQNGERTRTLYLLKSRGMSHSTQVREFLLTDAGVDLVDVCVSGGGVLTGSARREYEARQAEELLRQEEEYARRRQHLEARRHEMESQIEVLRRQYEEEEADFHDSVRNIAEVGERAKSERQSMTRSREQNMVTRSFER